MKPIDVIGIWRRDARQRTSFGLVSRNRIVRVGTESRERCSWILEESFLRVRASIYEQTLMKVNREHETELTLEDAFRRFAVAVDAVSDIHRP